MYKNLATVSRSSYMTLGNLLSVLASDIEKALTINQDGEQVQEWLEVGNGCICCSVKYNKLPYWHPCHKLTQ